MVAVIRDDSGSVKGGTARKIRASSAHTITNLMKTGNLQLSWSTNPPYQKIPNKFTSKYGGGVKNPVYLKPPDGTQWKVRRTQHDYQILFEKGWKEFAAYYSLDHGHLLQFEYNGTSCFERLSRGLNIR
ncbi:B3 domain-containing transcription factor VRN1-like [Arachis ipaensis]|uniref:B3 domain-containing transcription factor VRN1-like n=1 Tax=Arachis ipaensis TaxID=130454 RepID=UPI000A2B932B|nr:B3 domain-containing transcription factor VRN1-like [Arachis ipaensis]